MTNRDNQDSYYTGTSDSNGIIAWKDAGGNSYTAAIPDGTYTLEETKAPSGYLIGEQWTLTVTDGIPSTVTGTQGVGSPETEITIGSVTFYNQSGILTLYYDDTILYELPSAGGPGIFLYMIGGTLFMIAGSLMIYINRRRGVLRR